MFHKFLNTLRCDILVTWWRHLTLQWRHGSTFYLFHGLVWGMSVCEINRIHYWCSVGTGKSQPEGVTCTKLICWGKWVSFFHISATPAIPVSSARQNMRITMHSTWSKYWTNVEVKMLSLYHVLVYCRPKCWKDHWHLLWVNAYGLQ